MVQRLRAETVPESEAAAIRRAAAEHAKVADAKIADACSRADDADRELAAAVALGKKLDAQLAEVMRALFNPFPKSLRLWLVWVRLGAQFARGEEDTETSDLI